MCLGIPGEITELFVADDLRMAKVDFGGVRKRVCIEHTPEARVGDYVIVHVGFALQVIDQAEAKQVFQFLEQMNELEQLNDGETDDEQH